ncbi:MAG: FecR domain-containing protein [Kiritimatiellae bacterium]|nr:FecR domain-containing protein [Kiritimatiellia bacterium]
MSTRREQVYWLSSKYLDGCISPRELLELEALLHSDEAARVEFLNAVHLDSRLGVVAGAAVDERRTGAGGAAWERSGLSGGGESPRPIAFPVSAPRRTGRRWFTAAAAAILAGLGALFVVQWNLLGPALEVGESAILARVGGRVGVQRAHGEIPGFAGQPLQPGDVVTTPGAASEAMVVYADGSSIGLAGDTRLRLEPARLAGMRRVAVETGTIRAEVAAQPAGRAFLVTTPHAEVRVVGTLFIVAVQGTSTRVDVEQGRVEIRRLRDGECAYVLANQYAVVGETLVVAAKPLFGRQAADRFPRPPGLLALYTFEEGRGVLVRDVAGAGAPLDLTADTPGGLRWLPGGGLALDRPTLLASRGAAAGLVRACKASNELTLEVWCTPVNPRQGTESVHDTGARIVTCSTDHSTRNFGLDQLGSSFGVRIRSTETGPNGSPEGSSMWLLRTADEVVRAERTHLVVTRDASGNVRLFVNGAELARCTLGGTFANWDAAYPLLLGRELFPEGSEQGRVRAWRGTYHRVAVYSRALAREEVRRLFEAGRPGTAGL